MLQEHTALEKQLSEAIQLAKGVRTEARALSYNLESLANTFQRFKLSGTVLMHSRGLLEGTKTMEQNRANTLEERLTDNVIAPLEEKLRRAREMHSALKQRHSLALDTQAYARKVEASRKSNKNPEKLDSRENKLQRSREALERCTERVKEDLRKHSATNRIENEIHALCALLADFFSSCQTIYKRPSDSE